MTSGETGNAPPARYGWLGAAQRNADTPTGAILMGVRLYHPATGRFLQTDQVAGGSASAYDYCNADPSTAPTSPAPSPGRGSSRPLPSSARSHL